MYNNFIILHITKSPFPSVFQPAGKNLIGSDGRVTHKNVSVGAPRVFIVTGIIYTIIIASRLHGGGWGLGLDLGMRGKGGRSFYLR